MDSFELNKIAGGVLGALTFVMLPSFGTELLFHEKPAAKAGYDLPMPEGTAAAAARTGQGRRRADRRAPASADKRRARTPSSSARPALEREGRRQQGRPRALERARPRQGQQPGFAYSNALKAVAAKGEKWDFETVDKFVEGAEELYRRQRPCLSPASRTRRRAPT